MRVLLVEDSERLSGALATGLRRDLGLRAGRFEAELALSAADPA